MPSLRKVPRSPYWIACFRDKSGMQFNRSTKKTKKSDAMLIALEFERMAGGWIEENGTMSAIHQLASDLRERLGDNLKVMSVRDCFENYLAGLESKAESTRVRYKQVVGEFLSFLGRSADKRLIALSESEVLGYRDSRLKAGLAPGSSDCELKIIRAALRRAELAGHIKTNPASLIPLINQKSCVRDVFEGVDVEAMLKASDSFNFRSRNSGKDWGGAILVAFYTGARLSDTANLRWENVDMTKRLLRFSEKKKRFTTEISVPLHPDLEAHLLSLPANDDKSSPLFPSLFGRETGGGGGLSLEFVALMDAAGIKRRVLREGGAGKGKIGRNVFNLGEHCFRHSFNTHLMRAGVSEDVRQRLSSHDSKEVSRRYTHVEVEDLRGSVALLPRLSKKSQNKNVQRPRKAT
jgi:integrase